jgi:hypothetical protein
VISGFHHEVDENCVLLGYALSSGNFLLTVWDNLSISSSKVKNKKKILTLEEGNNMLSRNVGTELPLLVA